MENIKIKNISNIINSLGNADNVSNNDSNNSLNTDTQRTNKIDKKYKDQCIELKNIEYKTMLLKGNGKLAPTGNNSFNIESILDKESTEYKKETWNKLDNTIKRKKLHLFAEQFAKDNSLSDDELNIIKDSLIHYLDRKMINKSKEVTYNKETGLIETIPILEYNVGSRRFTLKRNGKTSINMKPPKTRKKNDKISDKSDKCKIDTKKE